MVGRQAESTAGFINYDSQLIEACRLERYGGPIFLNSDSGNAESYIPIAHKSIMLFLISVQELLKWKASTKRTKLATSTQISIVLILGLMLTPFPRNYVSPLKFTKIVINAIDHVRYTGQKMMIVRTRM